MFLGFLAGSLAGYRLVLAATNGELSQWVDTTLLGWGWAVGLLLVLAMLAQGHPTFTKGFAPCAVVSASLAAVLLLREGESTLWVPLLAVAGAAAASTASAYFWDKTVGHRFAKAKLAETPGRWTGSMARPS